MKTIPAKEAKNRFGTLLDTAQREPVRITKKDRPVAVVLSGDNPDSELQIITPAEYLRIIPKNQVHCS